MERRDFILKSGTLITAASLVGVFGNTSQLLAQPNSSTQSDVNKRPHPDDFDQPIMKAIVIGINSASPHNTQSWKFKVVDDYSMHLYIDENKTLPETDPPCRQIHIGAGCFIETLVVGISDYGYECDIHYFPEGYSSKEDFGKKPVAKIALKKAKIEKDGLSSYIYTRHTNRKKYKGEIISDEEFETLKKLAGEGHCELKFINKNFEPYFEIFKKAFETESRTYRTNEETRNWFRFSEKERAEKGDGLSIPQAGFSGISKYFAESSLDHGNKEKWHSEKSIALSLENQVKGIKSSKGIVIWKTETNEFEDWIKTGRDFARFCLALTQQGFYAHPYTQATQEYAEMDAIRNELDNLLNIKGDQKIQMVIRIGRCSSSYISYRRKVKSYLIS